MALGELVSLARGGGPRSREEHVLDRSVSARRRGGWRRRGGPRAGRRGCRTQGVGRSRGAWDRRLPRARGPPTLGRRAPRDLGGSLARGRGGSSISYTTVVVSLT